MPARLVELSLEFVTGPGAHTLSVTLKALYAEYDRSSAPGLATGPNRSACGDVSLFLQLYFMEFAGRPVHTVLGVDTFIVMVEVCCMYCRMYDLYVCTF